jgi:hypothetical protein
MKRYSRILSAALDAAELPLPVSFRVSRSLEASPAAGDADAFVSSVQASRGSLVAELRMRDTSAAENLPLGQSGTLTVRLAPAGADHAGRTVTLRGAVLTGVDLAYDQSAMASATLRFTVESPDGENPFAAEDAP